MMPEWLKTAGQLMVEGSERFSLLLVTKRKRGCSIFRNFILPTFSTPMQRRRSVLPLKLSPRYIFIFLKDANPL